ncbi:Holliday junction resolvase RuvX [Zhihengliuella sp.]|uniref:Holliday junction resolvase RuvX n=1 Tax=Zhihengliuella sp. TaxID=1954483 RepID=UPI002811D318|nr:Holliday junction resolvase RuvX [Zhihengliuella sp.]
MAERGTRLGVDVGQARVGVASSDPDGLLATPWRTLTRDEKKDSDIRVLVRHACETGATVVYVGLPRNLKGHDTASTRMARDYAVLVADGLAAAGSRAVVRLVDERLSTVTAHRSLHEAGVGSRQHRAVVDQAAATAILQHALDMERSLRRDVGDAVEPRTGMDGSPGQKD